MSFYIYIYLSLNQVLPKSKETFYCYGNTQHHFMYYHNNRITQ